MVGGVVSSIAKFDGNFRGGRFVSDCPAQRGAVNVQCLSSMPLGGRGRRVVCDLLRRDDDDSAADDSDVVPPRRDAAARS